MLNGSKGMTAARKWNLLMVFAIFGCILAQQFVGHIVDINEKLDIATTVFGVGLVFGVLFQMWRKRKDESE